MASKSGATIEDLYHIPENGKAELVNGELVLMCPTGGIPGRAGGRIYRSLDDYERQTQSGFAFPDNVGFLVNLPHRHSFSPDAAFHPGPLQGGQFLSGAPLLAVEVRSEGDYGAQAEQEMTDKRADYFATGTQIVWDVDVLRAEEIRKYSARDPNHPTIFRRGEIADAEPALPGWRFPIDDLFT